MEKLAIGARVIVAPACYPLTRWRGIVERRTPRGYRVRYECGGATLRDCFAASEVQPESPSHA